MAGELVSPTPALRGSARRTAALRLLRRRLIQAVPLMLGVVIINFCLIQMAPGSFLELMTAENQVSDPATVALLRKTYGLDDPVWMQLLKYIWALLHFDFGFSYRHNMPVAQLIGSRLPATLLLMVAAIGLAFTLGVLLGVTAARHVRKPIDGLISVVALLAYATPVFWIGLMLTLVFSVQLDWLPSGGMNTIGADLAGVDAVLDVARHMVLPTVTLSLFYLALYTRLMRASMLEVYGQDYVTTARAKGAAEGRIAFRHVLRNALLPMVTMLGLQVGSLLGGSVLVETVFGWPGLGRLAFEAVFQRDHNLLLGILLLSSVLVVVANIVVDLLYAKLDPRIGA
jgi:peptide/nickel transport system permease protein